MLHYLTNLDCEPGADKWKLVRRGDEAAVFEGTYAECEKTQRELEPPSPPRDAFWWRKKGNK